MMCLSQKLPFINSLFSKHQPVKQVKWIILIPSFNFTPTNKATRQLEKQGTEHLKGEKPGHSAGSITPKNSQSV